MHPGTLKIAISTISNIFGVTQQNSFFNVAIFIEVSLFKNKNLKWNYKGKFHEMMK